MAADNFQVTIDSYHDHRNARHFEINAAGTQADGVLAGDNGAVDKTWDGVWDAAVAVTETGWRVEMAIPFSLLRFQSRDMHTFGVNFKRFIARKNEWVSWIDLSSVVSIREATASDGSEAV